MKLILRVYFIQLNRAKILFQHGIDTKLDSIGVYGS